MAKTGSKSKRLRRALRLVLGGLGAVGFFWVVYIGLTWDMRRDESVAESGYKAVRVKRGDLSVTVVATGVMEPFARVVVQSEIPGIVEALHADDGDRVERGQPIVELDRSRLEDRAGELRASLALEEALTRIDVVGRAQAHLDKARRDYQRVAKLGDQGVTSRERMDQLSHERRLAQISLSDAHADRAARLAAVDRARMALRRVERDLEKSIIRSPIEGVLVSRHVEVGAAVADLQNGGTVVAILADDRRIHLLGEVDENDIADVRVGQRADCRLDSFPGEVFAGTVRKISAAGNTQGGVSTFSVEIEFDPDERIRIGMSADAHIRVRNHVGVLLVPNAAILRTENGPRVRVVDVAGSSEHELRAISEIFSDGFMTAVQSGVREDDLVLVRSRKTDSDSGSSDEAKAL